MQVVRQQFRNPSFTKPKNSTRVPVQIVVIKYTQQLDELRPAFQHHLSPCLQSSSFRACPGAGRDLRPHPYLSFQHPSIPASQHCLYISSIPASQHSYIIQAFCFTAPPLPSLTISRKLCLKPNRTWTKDKPQTLPPHTSNRITPCKQLNCKLASATMAIFSCPRTTALLTAGKQSWWLSCRKRKQKIDQYVTPAAPRGFSKSLLKTLNTWMISKSTCHEHAPGHPGPALVSAG